MGIIGAARATTNDLLRSLVNILTCLFLDPTRNLQLLIHRARAYPGAMVLIQQSATDYKTSASTE